MNIFFYIFINMELDNLYNSNNFIIYEYDKPKYGINVSEFYKHCENGKSIKLNKET